MPVSMHFRPDFEHWRKLEALAVWEIGFLLIDVDPRLAADYVVEDREEEPMQEREIGKPKELRPRGSISPCFAGIKRRLLDAVAVGTLNAVTSLQGSDPRSPPDDQVKIDVSSLRPWLIVNGFTELARELAGRGVSREESATILLARLRELGGRPVRTGEGEWRFEGIKRLVESLKISGQAMTDKTVRARLTEAAEREESGRREGVPTSSPAGKGDVTPWSVLDGSK